MLTGSASSKVYSARGVGPGATRRPGQEMTRCALSNAGLRRHHGNAIGHPHGLFSQNPPQTIHHGEVFSPVHGNWILISCRATGPDGDRTLATHRRLRVELQLPSRVSARRNLALVILLDVAGGRPGQIPRYGKIIGPHNHGMHRIVDEQGDGLAGEVGKLENRDRLIGRSVRIVAQPPPPLFGKEFPAIDVHVGLAGSETELRRLEIRLGLAHGLERVILHFGGVGNGRG